MIPLLAVASSGGDSSSGPTAASLVPWVLLWGLIWAGLFYATVLLLSLWFTRRGEEIVTRRALVLALLLHGVAGLFSTTVSLGLADPPIRVLPTTTNVKKVVVDDPAITPRKAPLDKDKPAWEKRDLDPKLDRDRQERAKRDLEKSEVTRPVPAADEPPQVAAPDSPPEYEQQTPDQPDVRELAMAETRPQSTLPDASPEDLPATALQPDASPTERRVRTTRSRAGSVPLAPERMSRSGDPNDQSATIATPGPTVSTTETAPIDSDLPPTLRETAIRDRNPRTAKPSDIVPESTGVTEESSSADIAAGAPSGSVQSRRGPQGKRRRGPDSEPRSRNRSDEPADDMTFPSTTPGLSETELADASNPAPPRFDSPTGRKRSANGAATKAVPEVYELRDRDVRKSMAESLGATRESEQAVERALDWFARHQHPKGYWDADGFNAQCLDGRCTGVAQAGVDPGNENFGDRKRDRAESGLQADTGLTALVVLCYLGAGYTHEEGRYADQLSRALQFLMTEQRSNGFLGGTATHYARMYCHSMATIALAEAYGMTRDPQLREPVELAVKYIVVTQLQDGGWRYTSSHQAGDMSLLGWQIMALKSAGTAGIAVPESTVNKAAAFLESLGDARQPGLVGYLRGRKPTRAMTAEALFCRQILGSRPNSPTIDAAAQYLQTQLPERSNFDLYYYYYGTLAMYQRGGTEWEQWNGSLRDMLVSDQETEGCMAGSWTPRGPWSDFGGRLFSTAMSTLCLEVYYRFVPGAGRHNLPKR